MGGEKWQSRQHRQARLERGRVENQISSHVNSFKFVNLLSSDVNNDFLSSGVCIYTNSDNLLNKRAEFKAIIEHHDPMIMAITEVKPKNTKFAVQECEIAQDGYELFHNLEKKGRGVALYVKPELKPTVCEQLESNFEECIFVECKSGDEKFRIGLIYRSPSSTTENNENLNKLIMEAVSDNPKNLLILGDFNYKEIDWSSQRCNTDRLHPANHFLETCKDAFLIQNQSEPTRYRQGQEPSLLDLVLTNREDIINEINTEASLGKSDHATLILSLSLSYQKTPRERFAFTKADYNLITKYLQDTDWDTELEGLSTNDMWKKIKDIINCAIKLYVPLVKIRDKKRKQWMDKTTLAAVREKHKLFRKWIKSRDDTDHQNYLEQTIRLGEPAGKPKDILNKQ